MMTEGAAHLDLADFTAAPTWSAASAGAVDVGRLEIDVHTDMSNPALWAAWDRLEQTGSLSVFQTRFFMQPFLTELVPASRAAPIVVTVHDADGRPQVIVPFVMRRVKGLRKIELADLDLCDYAAPLMARDAVFDRAGAAQLWRRIVARLPAADAVTMKKMPPTVGNLANPLALLPGVAAMGVTTAVVPMAGVDITRTGAYKDAAGKIRKMKKAGDYRFLVARDATEADRLIDAMILQRRVRCAELGQTSNLDEPEIDRFFRGLAHQGCADGRVSLTAIEFDGTLIAVIYGFVHRGRWNGIVTAMGGEEYRRYSPGLCNMVETQAHWKAEGLDVFDIGVGNLHYKERFDGRQVDLFEYQQPLTTRGRIVAIEARLRRSIRHYLDLHPELNRRVRRVVGK